MHYCTAVGSTVHWPYGQRDHSRFDELKAKRRRIDTRLLVPSLATAVCLALVAAANQGSFNQPQPF